MHTTSMFQSSPDRLASPPLPPSCSEALPTAPCVRHTLSGSVSTLLPLPGAPAHLPAHLGGRAHSPSPHTTAARKSGCHPPPHAVTPPLSCSFLGSASNKTPVSLLLSSSAFRRFNGTGTNIMYLCSPWHNAWHIVGTLCFLRR